MSASSGRASRRSRYSRLVTGPAHDPLHRVLRPLRPRAPENEFTDREFLQAVCAHRLGEERGIAAAKRAWRKAHRRRHQVHRFGTARPRSSASWHRPCRGIFQESRWNREARMITTCGKEGRAAACCASRKSLSTLAVRPGQSVELMGDGIVVIDARRETGAQVHRHVQLEVVGGAAAGIGPAAGLVMPSARCIRLPDVPYPGRPDRGTRQPPDR